MSLWLCFLLASSVAEGLTTSPLPQGSLPSLVESLLREADGTIIGGSVVPITQTGGSTAAVTSSFGLGGSTRSVFFGVDTCVNMNSMMAVLVSAALIKLQRDTQFIASLDVGVTGVFSPTGAALSSSAGAAITYRSLMQHTSTLLDTTFDQFTTTAPTAVGTSAAFLTAYLNLATSFSTGTVGSPAAYAVARINTAVLAFAANAVITSRNLQYRGIEDYLLQEFLSPLGMGSTFLLGTTGVASGLSPFPTFAGTFTAADYTQATAYTSYFQGCIGDQLAAVPLHPATLADYMPYATTKDVGRMMVGLFTKTAFTAIASEMQQFLSITVGTTTGQIGQGLGVMQFSPTALCALVTTLGVTMSCAINGSVVYGFVASRAYVSRGVVCATATTQGVACTSVSLLHSSPAVRTPTAVLSLAAAALQDLLAPTSTVVATAVGVVDEFQGLYAFLGIYLTLLAVYVATQVVQWLLLPVSTVENP